ncbi:hypothetical protein D082_30340 [Synechocystis sp. PCC 6714]|nr:hypothetical protein D082_30340 [Synechocystis sp. PCC 6714]
MWCFADIKVYNARGLDRSPGEISPNCRSILVKAKVFGFD